MPQILAYRLGLILRQQRRSEEAGATFQEVYRVVARKLFSAKPLDRPSPLIESEMVDRNKQQRAAQWMVDSAGEGTSFLGVKSK